MGSIKIFYRGKECLYRTIVGCLMLEVGGYPQHRTSNFQPPTKNMKEIINTDKASKPLGAYPHARKVGNLLFLSGIGPRNPKDNSIPGLKLSKKGKIKSYDIEAECHSVFAN